METTEPFFCGSVFFKRVEYTKSDFCILFSSCLVFFYKLTSSTTVVTFVRKVIFSLKLLKVPDMCVFLLHEGLLQIFKISLYFSLNCLIYSLTLGSNCALCFFCCLVHVRFVLSHNVSSEPIFEPIQIAFVLIIPGKLKQQI